MLLLKLNLNAFIRIFPAASRHLCTTSPSISTVLQKLLNITDTRAQSILLRQPSICKHEPSHLQQVVNVVEQLGFNKLELINDPVTFTYLPITIKYRCKVLKECGFNCMNLRLISRYLTLVKKTTVSELKLEGLIHHNTEVSRNLARIFKCWPTSHSQSLLTINEAECTLHEARMKILQRYLELVIDLSEEDFKKKIDLYVRIKHRPFEIINEMIELLLYHILMPVDKIKANMFVIHADPENVKQLIYQVPTIGSRTMKDIIKQRPKFCTTNVENIVEIRKLFKENGISENKQVRCLEVFTLSHKTIKERMERIKSIPEFEVLKDHPRILKIIYNEKSAIERLKTLENSYKKCFSLNILSGSEKHYKVYQESPGDRSKGTDLLYGIHSQLGQNCSIGELKVSLKRHPFWINVPLLQAISVCKNLTPNFSHRDILENCVILLYPWDKIEIVLNNILSKKFMTISSNCKLANCPEKLSSLENIDLCKLTKSQILSLTLYLLEKDHYFSGNGMWTHNKLNRDKTFIDQNVNDIVTANNISITSVTFTS